MPTPREWPTKADQARMDIIALSLDLQMLTSRTHEVLARIAPCPEIFELANMNLTVNKKSKRIQQIAQEARRQCTA